MTFTCEHCGWWADINGVSVCGYSGRPTVRHDSCEAWKTTISTNADRIRQMSDEELAEWLDNNDSYFPIGDSRKKWLDWLKSPVEEAEG